MTVDAFCSRLIPTALRTRVLRIFKQHAENILLIWPRSVSILLSFGAVVLRTQRKDSGVYAMVMLFRATVLRTQCEAEYEFMPVVCLG